MAKFKGTIAPFKITTPKVEAYYHNLVTPDEESDKYDCGVVIDDSPELQEQLDKLLEFQNEELQKAGEDTRDTLLCLKDEKSKDENTGKWTVKTGRKLLFFKSGSRDKFVVVGPDKKPIDPSTIAKGDTIRVNAQPIFGFMKGDPYVSFWLNAVQLVESGGVSGVDAFDDETGGRGDGSDFEDETSGGAEDII